MGELIADFTAKALLSTEAGQQELSILCGVDSFRFAIQQKGGATLNAYRYYQLQTGTRELLSQLEELISHSEFLPGAYAKVRIYLDIPQFTLIPDRLYREEDAMVYLQHITAVEKSSWVSGDLIEAPDARLVYGIPAGLHLLLKHHFPTAERRHLLYSLLHYARRTPDLREADQALLLYRSGNRLYSLVLERQNLKLANAYPLGASEDMLYFTLLLLDQFGLSQRQTPIYLAGAIRKADPVFGQLKTYLQRLRFAPPPAGFVLPDTDLPVHRFLELT